MRAAQAQANAMARAGVMSHSIGGAFGARGEFYPEDFLIPFAAKFTGRPVRWLEDRRENLLATNHAREAECELEIACTSTPILASASSDITWMRRSCSLHFLLFA